ncbi:membrane-spanning 4-domains subfamily A member 4A [Lampris incognitus]|uniref:membrane-spanning 4-domains subfamily A member 4A n=1 Tax=Lampris incognitus TaxID=2546036 RepID=UPI0024B4D36F|nr:membrane-spanning 4-domains subfamily A member 4A [Lampris incognitus]
MSTACVRSPDGLLVITQVFSADAGGASLAPPPDKTAPPEVSRMAAAFLRGEPQSLGIVQIFIGLVIVMVSMSAVLSPSQLVQAPLGMGMTFVLSGSLALAARKGTSLGLIKATLATHILSVTVALMGVGYLCWRLSVRLSDQEFCGLDDMHYDSRSRGGSNCISAVRMLNMILDGVQGLVLILMVLETCVAITLCVFSGKAISRGGSYMMVPLESGSPQAANPASESDSNVVVLDDAAEESASTPPPYSP